jgi:hypothetical protein
MDKNELEAIKYLDGCKSDTKNYYASMLKTHKIFRNIERASKWGSIAGIAVLAAMSYLKSINLVYIDNNLLNFIGGFLGCNLAISRRNEQESKKEVKNDEYKLRTHKERIEKMEEYIRECAEQHKPLHKSDLEDIVSDDDD